MELKIRVLSALIIISVLGLGACIDSGTVNDIAAVSETAFEINEPAIKTFSLAEIHLPGFPTEMGVQEFARLVSEKTNGDIEIIVYNAGRLGDEKLTVEQTQLGDIHFVRVGLNMLSPINQKFDVLTMPYLYRDTEHMFNVLDGEIGDEFLELLKDDGLIGLCWLDPGTRNFYNSKREIRSPADMEGLRIRVQETPLMKEIIRLLNATPVPMPFGDVYFAIQDDIVDGAENNFSSYMSRSHYNVAKYITLSSHIRTPELILVNTDIWENFTADERAIIKEAALEAAEFQRKEWIRHESAEKQEAIEIGSIITELTAEELELFIESVQPIYEDEAYAGYIDLIKRIKAVQ